MRSKYLWSVCESWKDGALVDADMLLAQSEELENGLAGSVIPFGLLLVRNSA